MMTKFIPLSSICEIILVVGFWTSGKRNSIMRASIAKNKPIKKTLECIIVPTAEETLNHFIAIL